MGRKAVQHDCSRISLGDKRLIQTETLERPLPFGLFLLLAHRSPDIGVKSLRSPDGRCRVRGHRDLCTSHCQGSRLVQNPGERFEAFRAADAHIHPEQSATYHQ